MNANAGTVAAFQPLGQYAYPPLPVADSTQSLARRVRRLWRRPDQQPFIADDRLRSPSQATLNDIASPPACGPLLTELEAALGDWVANDAPRSWLKLIVLPPGDENGLIAAWANSNGYPLLPPPDRGALIAGAPAAVPELGGDGVLVIPQLEHWFLRHHNGLTAVRLLLGQLDALQRHCLIGCNSWAWAFLTKAVEADMLLPHSVTFTAFDAARLHAWFSELATQDTRHAVRFRLSHSGADVMATNPDGTPAHDYFYRLAARSLGIPWVAWHLWRRSLRSGTGDEDDAADVAPAAGRERLWITAFDEFALPDEHAAPALLALQAMLIHGALSVDELRHVLPLVGESNILVVLLDADLIERKNGTIACLPAAYPTVRHGLSTAGFTMDRL